MTRTVLVLGALLSLLFAIQGCSVRRGAVHTTTVTAPPPPPPQPQPQQGVGAGLSVSAGPVQLGAGVQILRPTCGGNEVCGDGIDNNCDGTIDEGCGYSSGNIQVTLSWGDGADLDLYVTAPTGETVSYQNRQVRSGGALDVDARGLCGRGRSRYTVENVFWGDSYPPPRGQYRVDVHNFPCRSAPRATQAVLSIAVGHQVIGSYNVTLAQNQRATVAYFNVP